MSSGKLFDEADYFMCEEQSATVTDNNDLQGLSRIRVQFPWQKVKGGESPWIRVTTPYAGKGKGMHIIPEVGEEVIVGFENGNAEKPVVLGAMFNGGGKSGHGGAGNYMKGLQTAAGSNLTFNDKAGSMNLADKGGARMNFDGAGNATTAVKQNNTTNAGSTNVVNVGGEGGAPESCLKMDAGGNITLEANTKITIKVGGNEITISEEGIVTKAAVGKIESTADAGPVSIESKAAEATFKGSTTTTVDGADVVVSGGGTIRVGSPDTDIN